MSLGCIGKIERKGGRDREREREGERGRDREREREGERGENELHRQGEMEMERES